MLAVSTICVAYPGSESFVSDTSRLWSVFLTFREKSTPELPQIASKLTDFTAIKWFTGPFGVEKDSKWHIPMPGSIASTDLASQVLDVRQGDWPANSRF